MKTLNQEVVDAPIGEINPHPRNPRLGNIDAIRESIDINGWYGHVIAQRSTGYILVGNHRYRAAKEAGAETVSTIWVDVDDLTAENILLNDNLTNDLADYDADALDRLLRKAKASADGLAGTGFTDADLADDLDDLEMPGEGDYHPAGAKRLADTFLAPPFSTLDALGARWQTRLAEWDALRVEAQSTGDDPVLAEILYHWFCPPEGSILNPLPGRTAAQKVAAHTGRPHFTIEDDPGKEPPITPSPQPRHISTGSIEEPADMLLAMPQTGKDSAALIAAASKHLAEDRFAVIILPPSADQRPYVTAMRNAGLVYYNEIVVVGKPHVDELNARRAFSRERHLAGRHNPILVFLKGDARKIAKLLPHDEIPEADDDEVPAE